MPRYPLICAMAAYLGTASLGLSAVTAPCGSLSALKLRNAMVTKGESVAASQSPAAVAFCRVSATLTPSSDSDIEIEVWLPSSGWNGKLLGVGNGGWQGSINRDALAAGLRRGYAAAATDTGHEGGGGPWMQRPEKLIDFGYRAVHEMAVTAKAVAAAFYGRAPRLSYFTGCSGGGRQGLKAAQRFPDDFDGIVAGAPAVNTTGRAAFSMWIAQTMLRGDGSFIPAEKYAAIHEAVLRACDARDSAADGLITDPEGCAFDPEVLACRKRDVATCLTPAQVESARAMYEPLINPRTKQEIAPGLSYGSELGWSTFGGAQPFGLGLQMFHYMVFNDPAWDYRTLNFDTDMALVDRIEAGNINALDPNLKPFIARGGKLIQYHGWEDPQIQPASSVRYYQSVLKALGGRPAVHGNYRLFMVPGMAHCRGGTGTSQFDMLAALEQWVEDGRAPDRVIASRIVNGRTERTRPLCAYPQIAAYGGIGSLDDAASFVCADRAAAR